MQPATPCNAACNPMYPQVDAWPPAPPSFETTCYLLALREAAQGDVDPDPNPNPDPNPDPTQTLALTLTQTLT
eukprot:scaffold3633_cov15-Phaeocystis_antarctica.AAC.1